MSQIVEYKEDYQIRIERDDNSHNNPRINCDNLGEIVCFHPQYTIGDEHKYSKEDVIDMVNSGKYISLPVYLYNHSGLTINTTGFNCKWDSGQVGYVLVSKDKVRKEYDWKYITKKREKQISEYLRNEVEILDMYLRGDIYCYVIEKNGDTIDSCRGFYGHDHEKSGLLESAKNSIDCTIKQRLMNEEIQTKIEFPIKEALC